MIQNEGKSLFDILTLYRVESVMLLIQPMTFDDSIIRGIPPSKEV
jgi:hypothetical protein